jgi:hypothetical protein
MEGEGMDEEAPNPTVENEPCDPAEIYAAQKVQKMYRSYRTRRRLADTAVIAEEFWSVILSLHSGSFCNYLFCQFCLIFTSLFFCNFRQAFNSISKHPSFCFGI